MLEENRPEVLRMEIESLSRNEEFARVVVSVFMARMNPTLEELDDVKTAVSEAVTNAVIHGYQGNGGIIYLEVKILGQELTVTVKDTGIGIPNIPQAMEPMFTTGDAEERAGLGFAVMQSFMDKVRVSSAPGRGTRVTLTKRLQART